MFDAAFGELVARASFCGVLGGADEGRAPLAELAPRASFDVGAPAREIAAGVSVVVRAGGAFAVDVDCERSGAKGGRSGATSGRSGTRRGRGARQLFDARDQLGQRTGRRQVQALEQRHLERELGLRGTRDFPIR